ncbi:MAG: valine--tRNA ligase [Saprospiraceae bacterium]
MSANHYDPSKTEEKWYRHWETKKYFRSVPDEREPYTIVIPPPNVTGVLHMGHMLNNTIQDVLIRRARKKGYNACWVPGTDHASIATEAKVVQMLRKQGIKKSDISREKFFEYAFEWKEKYGGIILEQLKKLGASCDWDRTRFTMEPSLSRAVIHVFVDLYKKGKLYRGLRMTNWDPEAKTALSNEEVIYRDEPSQLFHIRYPLADDPSKGIVIATQRPETIMADTAISVHPEDERYKDWVGKTVLIPLINKPIPIIADEYVDREFGTGALKITPAHDPNDYEIGLRHGLPVVDILTEDGKLNEQAQILVGEDRFEARKKIKGLLKEAGALVKLEDYVTSIGHSERTDAVVEPRLTMQWFLEMKDFAKVALDAVKSGEVKFFPESMWNMYYQWLRPENVRDWCISRQLWWGQRIPAWYLKTEDGRWTVDGEEVPFVAETAEEALAIAKEKTGNPNLTLADLEQDEDVVDTWFSSWLWPISVFDGFERQDELKYYYPTNALVTGWDIMFFWVARMIMSGYEYAEELLGEDCKGRQPFYDVYFTGMVRDNKRRKMSKSLGNSPDALELLAKYGADGVRFGLLLSTSAGNDIIFDAPFDPKTNAVLNESKICEQGRNFCNKIWNALQLVKSWEVADKPQPGTNRLAVQWLENKFNRMLAEAESNFKQYRLSDVLMSFYQLFWVDFCSWFLEVIKPAFDENGKRLPVDQATYEFTLKTFEKFMSVLHPFMPFVTEEAWHALRDRAEGDDVIVSPWPEAAAFDEAVIRPFEQAKDIISKVREARQGRGISPKEALNLFVDASEDGNQLLAVPGVLDLLRKMANLDAVELTSDEPASTVSFLSGKVKLYLEIASAIDAEEEKARIQKELDYYRGFVESVRRKLSNERFVNNAPEAVVNKERQKLADGEEKIRLLEESLERLGG